MSCDVLSQKMADDWQGLQFMADFCPEAIMIEPGIEPKSADSVTHLKLMACV